MGRKILLVVEPRLRSPSPLTELARKLCFWRSADPRRDWTRAGIIEEVLLKKGHYVGVATSGDDCLRRCAADAPSLLIVSEYLGDMKADELVTSLSAQLGGSIPPVLLLLRRRTGVDSEFRDFAKAFGRDTVYLVEPINPLELVAVVKRIFSVTNA